MLLNIINCHYFLIRPILSFLSYFWPENVQHIYFFKFELGGNRKSRNGKNDKIDFQSDIEWPPGQAPQVKRKLEHVEYKIVTATLVHTDNGAKIVVKGVEDPALLSEDQKDFIREQVKEVLLREIAKSKRWGKIPSVQSTFQLAIGNFFWYLLLLLMVRYCPTT